MRAFIARCSPETLYRRFHGTGPRAIDRELLRIASPADEHRSWVVVDGGEVRGTASLARSRSGATEMAVLVEDRWFRRGIGRALIGALMAHADRVGLETITASIQADNQRAVRFIRAVAPGASSPISRIRSVLELIFLSPTRSTRSFSRIPNLLAGRFATTRSMRAAPY